VQTYQGGLNFPVDMAWVRGTKKIFFTQKNGKIRVMVGRTLKKRACATLNVNAVNERGLLGIALGPHFKRSHHLYVYYTHASPLQNRVARFTVGNNRCRNKTDVVTGISASSSGYHNGGQIEFVRGKMYVSVGEAHSAGNAQVKTNRLGKILRYRPDGSIPRGNPFRKNGHRNPVWTYGHRNPFGLTHVPGTTRILETENGPECDDEVNRIVKGRNYGWGDNYQCGTAGVGSNPKRPMTRYNPTIAPTDAIFYRGRLRAWRNDLFFGDFNNHHLHRLVLGSHQSRVVRQRVIYTAPTGIVDTSIGPSRWLYLLTTNSIMRIARR
jgi:glucose/arabinose dehydrogenase